MEEKGGGVGKGQIRGKEEEEEEEEESQREGGAGGQTDRLPHAKPGGVWARGDGKGAGAQGAWGGPRVRGQMRNYSQRGQ